MANEIKIAFNPSKTLYVLILNAVGKFYNNTSQLFETYSTANLGLYALSLTQVGTSRFYEGSFPTTIPSGTYDMICFQQIGGSPAESDPQIGTQSTFGWSGTAQIGPSDGVTSGQLAAIAPLKIFRGEMVLNFEFKLVSSEDHVTPFTSGIVSGQISKDGGAFQVLQSGAYTEVGLGFYNLQALTSGDLFAGTVAIVFNAVGISGGEADQRDFTFILQRGSSGG